MSDDWGSLDKDSAAEPICPECEWDLTWMDCGQCEDGMIGHDCGEDCCACLEPEPNMHCDVCGGAGGWYVCRNPQCETDTVSTSGEPY